MATIRFGPTIADVRGSAGPISYSRNKSAHYISQRSTKPAPTTTTATAARSAFAAAAQAWRTLNATQRTAWNNLAAAPPEIDYDPWTVQKLLTGFAWFVRVHTRQNSTAETLPTDPPTDTQPTPPTITAATIAPYGSANDASFITFTSPQPNTIPNGEFEPPYTDGVAANWKQKADAHFVPTQESADVYAGTASQKAVIATGPEVHWIQSTPFTLTTHPGYWFQCATKILDYRISRIYIIKSGEALQDLYVTLTNAAWLLRTQLLTPNFAGYHHLYVQNQSNIYGTWLLDAFKLTAPEYFILSATISPSAGRQKPDHSYTILHAGYSTTPTTISIGDALAAVFGAYPAGWTLFLKLERQTISGLRSTPALFTTTTG